LNLARILSSSKPVSGWLPSTVSVILCKCGISKNTRPVTSAGSNWPPRTSLPRRNFTQNFSAGPSASSRWGLRTFIRRLRSTHAMWQLCTRCVQSSSARRSGVIHIERFRNHFRAQSPCAVGGSVRVLDRNIKTPVRRADGRRCGVSPATWRKRLLHERLRY
jgi:hypothetical protein